MKQESEWIAVGDKMPEQAVIEREMRQWFQDHGVPLHGVSVRVEVRQGDNAPEPACCD